MKSRALLLLPLLAGLAACETVTPMGPVAPTPPPPPPPVSRDYGDDELGWSQEQGSGAIHGVLTYRNSAGASFTCAGGNVGLVPESGRTRDRMMRLYGTTVGAIMPASVVRDRGAGVSNNNLTAFIRTAACDDHNRFSFEGLPDGGWFIVLQAKAVKGGEPIAVMRRVDLHGGRAMAVNLD